MIAHAGAKINLGLAIDAFDCNVVAVDHSKIQIGTDRHLNLDVGR